ncbi:hypothetical protein RJT34_19561 [Clitoria ternatea]|uniref:APO domain-containing protein n=1 Tax=Clitoria ternatea TaxID=43366 RepID=A0AAN9P3N6_CLITE
MLRRRVQTIGNLLERVIQAHVAQLRGINTHFCVSYSTVSTCNELPRKLTRCERKPPVTSFNDLKREARLKRKERQKAHEIILQPPENGLLVEHLIPIAHEVYAARREPLSCVSRLVNCTAIYTCSLCGEVHVGHPPHKIRTCDVRGSPSSKEHSWVKGGFDIPEYPTRRRAFPVYCVAGRIIDFEKRFPKEISFGKDIDAHGFWYKKKRLDENTDSMATHSDDIQAIAVRGMKAWEKMCTGASRLMEKYAVQTCGYCPEIQVGPKGHRVRNCQAYKHQMRDGQHAWQEATINDLAGAPVETHYASMMREDVVIPEMDEEKLAV